MRRAIAIGVQLGLLVTLGFALMLRLPQVSGFSMEPRIDTGEWVVIDTVGFRLHPPSRGDVIAFTHAGSVPEVFLKRIIALPGDRLAIDRGVVYVNGLRVAEPYVRYADTRSVEETRIPADSYYVLGDNRVASNDSRAFGPIEGSTIVGPAIFAVWPMAKFGRIE